MQINVPFPLESTHLGYRCTTCLVLSFCTQGDLSKSEHMLGKLTIYKVSISLKLGYVQFEGVTCE